MNTVEQMNAEAKKGWPKKEIYLGALAIVFTIGLCAAAIYYKDDLMNIVNMTGLGLLGLFIISFIASSTFSITAVPLPFWLLVLTLPGVIASQWGVLAPVWVGLTTAVGIALGQLLTFMIGYGSRSLSERVTAKFNNRFYNRAMDWARRHGSWAVFIMSAIFNPIHLPMTIAIAALRYPPYKFFIYSLLGSSVKSLIVAFCGYFGLTSLFGFLGV
jgi:membrane protein DedA with SNARE-associated domain